MGKNKDYTKEEIIKAIEGSSGFYKVIAEKLDCHTTTLHRYIKKYDLGDAIRHEEKVNMVDRVAAGMITMFMDAETPHAVRASIGKYLLSSKGKKDGWGEKEPPEPIEEQKEEDKTLEIRFMHGSEQFKNGRVIDVDTDAMAIEDKSKGWEE